MKMPTITPGEFKVLLPLICDRETSQDAEHWSPENPLVGHCAVVSLLSQNLFGGWLLRASLEGIPEFARMRSHYWNKLADGSEEDFTKPQFGEYYPINLLASERERSYVLSYAETAKRYKLLAWRLAKVLSNGNPFFEDGYYRQCFDVAMDSPCQKMKFGCLITHFQQVIYKGCNETIPELKSLCDPKCIRLGITSRTESMPGACGHAEEKGLWEVARMRKFPLEECELYIAGFYPNGLPWIKERAEHTCLRCAVQMHYAGIRRIHVPVVDCWEDISTQRALQTALAYATGEKKV